MAEDRAKSRVIADLASRWGRGHPWVSPPVDSRAFIERLASWIYICADRNATEVSQQPLRLYTSKKSSGYPTKVLDDRRKAYLKSIVPQHTMREAIEIEDHPFLDLLEYVNPILDKMGLLWLTSTYLQCAGDAYWHLTFDQRGLPIEIWPLPSQFVFPMLGPQRVFDSYQVRYGGQIWEFPADDIIHFRKPSALDMVSGFGNLKGIFFAAETNLRMQEWENALFTNHAVPDFLISPKGDISQAQQNQLQADWQNTYGGWRNRGRFAVSPFELEIKNLQLNAKELQFKEGRKAILEEIAAGFGVPMNVLIVEEIKYNNMRHGLALWMRSTIKPIGMAIASALNTYMMPIYTPGGRDQGALPKRAPIFVAFDNPVPEDVDADAERLVKLSGGMPLLNPNEARAELGREPVEWGEEPFIPGGVRRPSEPIAGTAPDAGGAGEKPKEPKKRKSWTPKSLMAALRSAIKMGDMDLAEALRDTIGNQLGISVAPLPVRLYGDNNGSAERFQEQTEDSPFDRRIRGGLPASSAVNGTNKNGRDGRRLRFMPAKSTIARAGEECGCSGQDGHSAHLKYENMSYIEEAQYRAEDAFATDLATIYHDMYLETQRNATREHDNLDVTLVALILLLLGKIEDWQERFARVGLPYIMRSITQGVDRAVVELIARGVGLEVGFQLPADTIAAIAQRLTQKFASRVVAVTGRDVVESIREGLAAGEGVEGIAQRIAAVYGEKEDYSALRIARTELYRALNAGAEATWKAAGIESKQWVTYPDCCEFCATLDGMVIPIDEVFVKLNDTVEGVDGGAYEPKYVDILYPPLHPFCRCTIRAVIVEDKGDAKHAREEAAVTE